MKPVQSAIRLPERFWAKTNGFDFGRTPKPEASPPAVLRGISNVENSRGEAAMKGPSGAEPTAGMIMLEKRRGWKNMK